MQNQATKFKMASKVTQKNIGKMIHIKKHTHTQIYVEENFIAFIQNKEEEKHWEIANCSM